MSTTMTAAESRPLTGRQRAIYLFLYDTTRDTAIQPSYRDLMDRFDLGSTNAVESHLEALEAKGWIGRPGGQSRSIRFIRRPDGTKFDGFADKA